MTVLTIDPAVSSQSAIAFQRSEYVKGAICVYISSLIESAVTPNSVGLTPELETFVAQKGLDEDAKRIWVDRLVQWAGSNAHNIFIFENEEGEYTDRGGNILSEGSSPIRKTINEVNKEFEAKALDPVPPKRGDADYQVRDWINKNVFDSLSSLREIEQSIATAT